MATTTTTTSTYGATTTVTTTTSVTAPASGATQDYALHNGNMMGIMFQTFDTAANASRMDMCLEAMSNINPSGTKTSVYCIKISETERASVLIWNGEQGFLPLEKLFGQQAIVQELATSYQATMVVTGDVSIASRSKMMEWAAFPNWTITFDFNSMSCIRTEEMSPNSVGELFDFEFSSNAAREEYFSDWQPHSQAFGNRANTYVAMRSGDTKIVGAVLFKSVRDFDEYLKLDLGSEAASKAVAKTVGNLTTMKPYFFGNIGAPEVAQAMIAWPMSKPCNVVASPWGGDHLPVLATQKMYFDSAADRDNCCAQIDNADNFVNGGDGTHFAHVKIGETGILTVFGAKDFATFQAQEQLFMSKPNVLEAWGKMAACKNYFFGNTGAGFWADMAGWDATYPVMSSVNAQRAGGACFHDFSGKNLCVFVGEQTVKSEENLDELISFAYSTEVVAIYEKSKVTCQFYKLSPKSIGFLIYASSMDDWVACNDVFAPLYGERIGEIMESIKVHVLGPVTEKGKAAIDAWDQAPWCHVHFHEKVYGSL